MKSYEEIEKGLKRIRVLKLTYWLMFLGFFIIVPPIVRAVGDSYTPIVVGVYILSWLVLSNVENHSTCPLCEKKFFVKESSSWGYWNTFTFSCLNCKINLGGSNIKEARENIKNKT